MRLGALLINSLKEEYGCSKEMLILASMLSIKQNIFMANVDPPYVIKVK
jgi:hypothetical protein